MCSGALINARLQSVVFGASDARAGAAGSAAAGAAGSWAKTTEGAGLKAQMAQVPARSNDFVNLKVRIFGDSKVIGCRRIMV
jgi:tRNA(Arg) A34 adenosine deaminase TadA